MRGASIACASAWALSSVPRACVRWWVVVLGAGVACRAPLNLGGTWSVTAEVVDGECVVIIEHLQAGAALAGNGLWVLGA